MAVNSRFGSKKKKIVLHFYIFYTLYLISVGKRTFHMYFRATNKINTCNRNRNDRKVFQRAGP